MKTSVFTKQLKLAYLLNYLINNLLTSWSTVLLEKLTCSQLVKKFSSFYGIRMFITAFTSARHLSLSWARSMQSAPPSPTSYRSILILFFHLRLSILSGLFPSGVPTKPLMCPSFPHMCPIPRPSHSYYFHLPKNICWGAKIINILFT